MKKFDLNSMTEEQLRSLNREIVQRLELYSTLRRKSQLMAFRLGDRVAFETELGTVTGVIIRINQKTASIEGDDGRGWRVSPSFLMKIANAETKTQATDAQTNLFQFPSPKNT